MKRLSTGVLAALIVGGFGLNAVAAPPTQSQSNTGKAVIAQATESPPPPAPDFGTPPSGQIPILYNDHHVYSKPDVLKQGRVLAALVKDGTLLVPLRSMFEQMGATVSFDAGTKTVTVDKPGSQVKVTVGMPSVTINGESRPLDVPPIIYQGTVLVPVRVISEGMGAYVEWVPDKRLVVVRYVPPTPPPTPAPTEAPTAPPATPAPTPTPTKPPYKDIFIAGDYLFQPVVYNEFNPGVRGNSSYAVRGAWEFDLFNIPWMVSGDFRQFQYDHHCLGVGDPECLVTTIGQTGQTFVPAFTARNSDIDVHLGVKIFDPRVYIGVGYLWATPKYGYPRLTNVGFGAEKLPDLNEAFTAFGSIYYYPNAKGNFTDPGTGITYTLAYNVLKYEIGVNFVIPKTPIFIEAGYLGEGWTNKSNAPSGQTFNGPFAGLGIKF